MKVFVELVPVFGPYRGLRDMAMVKVAHPFIEIRCPCGWSFKGIERVKPAACSWCKRRTP